MPSTAVTKTEDSCKATTDFSQLLQDGTFTFNIGPNRKRHDVHIAAFKTISEPLGYMMTNGKLEESINKVAKLEDVEPAVFEQLAKYAYKGLCGIADGIIGERVKTEQTSLNRYRCHRCSLGTWGSSLYPFCTDTCKSDFNNEESCLDSWDPPTRYCVIYICTKHITASQIGVLCKTHNTKENRSRYTQVGAGPMVVNDNHDTKNSPVCSRKYGSSTHTHDELSEHIERHLTSTTSTNQPPDLLQHAKLYVLATKYMIPDLPAITLHKLHRNLVNFTIEDEHIDEIIDLVLYTYTNTDEGGNILDGTADKLRDLVMAYVAWKQKELTRYEAFRQMLAAGGAQTADYIALICA